MEYLKRTAIGLLALTVVGTGMSLSLSVVSPEAAIAKSRKKKYRARSNNIVRVAQKDGSYKTLTEAIGKAGLTRTLQVGGPFTVFAPSDAAFAKLPKAEVEELLADRDKLREVLKYHVVKGKILDIVIDLRKNSKTFGKVYSIILSKKNALGLFIPAGFAHGYYSFDKENIIYYKLDNYYNPKFESGIIYNDPVIKCKLPYKKIKLSKKDKNLMTFEEFTKKVRHL